MMRRLPLAAAALIAVPLAGGGPAVAERLVTSISRHQVSVNSSFVGTSIVLFGTVEPDTPNARRRATGYDLIVTVTGPKQTVVARRKERMLGIWTNVGSRTFLNVPSYLAVLSNQPLEQITSAETVRAQQLGLADKLLPQQLGNDVGDVARDDPFRVNFIRLKEQHKLYVQKTNGVTLLTPTVFRAEIPLPAETPIGNYDVDIKLFAEGAALTRANSAFEIIKVGFEQFIATAAQDYGLFYGLTTALMAILTGWFASVVFRRD
jgi:uncharacterized protein (TIGR02186 family)